MVFTLNCIMGNLCLANNWRTTTDTPYIRTKTVLREIVNTIPGREIDEVNEWSPTRLAYLYSVGKQKYLRLFC